MLISSIHIPRRFVSCSFYLHFIGRVSSFFLIISCSLSRFVTLHFLSCYAILCASYCAYVLLPFCLQLCSSHVLHLYVFVLLCSVFSFIPPPRCLFACYPHCESTLLGLAQRPEDIRDNPARYCEKLQAVSSAGLLYIRKDDYSKTLSGDYT